MVEKSEAESKSGLQPDIHPERMHDLPVQQNLGVDSRDIQFLRAAIGMSPSLNEGKRRWLIPVH
jgi:hypothetical protein